jgi:DNA repair protein RecN (Recombination protein N)
MLIRLSIRDIVLIDRLDIDFTAGLSVLTGETGAGKSILLDCFALALGGRGYCGLVRQGAAQGQVTAAFDVPPDHPARAILNAHDIPGDEDLILRRVQFADGRSRAFLNDQPVAVQVLRSVGGALVEIHGQHDDRALVDTAVHRGLLDAYGGLETEVAEVGRLWVLRRDAGQRAAQHRAEVERAEREADWLRHAAEELAQLAPGRDEETALADRRAGMMQAEKIAGDLRDVHAMVSGTDSPVATLAAGVRRLERRQAQAPGFIDPAVKALDVALTALHEANLHIEHALRTAAFDPRELERIEERLFALRAAGRKYNTPVDQLAALSARYSDDLALIDAGTARLAVLEQEALAAAAQYDRAAVDLSGHRRDVAAKLDEAVNRELRPLKLAEARFSTAITTAAAAAGPDGIDRVEFFVRTNPGTQPGPLMKVASGGELSRFMLALKVVIADRGSAPSLVFDEIDSGVGGAVADAIGARLARLAGRVQVLAVTHAPQVAARADHHYLITKDTLTKGRRLATRIAELAPALRREEIARMLAGAEITVEARAAAERLMQAAADA